MYRFWTVSKRFLHLFILLSAAFSALALGLGPEWPAFQNPADRIRGIVANKEFDFLVYELQTLGFKGEAALVEGDGFLDESSRKAIVLEFVTLIGDIRQLEGEIALVYSDPAVADPDIASAELQLQLSDLRVAAARLQPIAEATLEEQVADLLAEEGFAILGNVWPPVQMHMTPLPYILIVSPRESIQVAHNFALLAGLSTPDQEIIEQAVFDKVDMSALVVPIGGLGIFPSMILERGNLNWLAATIAHEWAHHWLSLQPIGLNYGVTPEMRTINETVASILGDQIGELVIERYYPELVPPPPPAPAIETTPTDEPANEPPLFDFREQMRITRLEVDRLLADGQVEEAEGYMEDRRQLFWDNGYKIRKLNQAYFAFYGSYADSVGARGEDPIGPTVLSVWAKSDSLEHFLDLMAPVTSFEDLHALDNSLP